jgi:hypothetical protein
MKTKGEGFIWFGFVLGVGMGWFLFFDRSPRLLDYVLQPYCETVQTGSAAKEQCYIVHPLSEEENERFRQAKSANRR